MSADKKACLVYVAATKSEVKKTRAALESEGFIVCETEAKIDDALAAKAGESSLPKSLADCIRGSDLCVFLLPESKDDDGLLGAAAALSNSLSGRFVGVVAGGRTEYPIEFEDHAHSMIRASSKRMAEAFRGEEIWENPDLTPIADRKIKTIRCQ